MPSINWLAILVAGIIPSVLGAIFYGPLFEKQWLSSLGKTKEEMVPNNMGLTYGLALLMAMLVSISLKMMIEISHKNVNANGDLILDSTHTFGHGAFHGAMIAILLVVPVVISLSLFQKNTGKNIMLNAIFWIICLALMGGVLDVWT